MQIPKLAALLLSFVLAGCATRSTPGRSDPMAAWRMDNPTVRKLQEQETAKHFPDTATQKHLKTSIGPCVEVLYADRHDDCSGVGRAVAITSDGYYLTAYHVVDDGKAFFTHEYIEKQPPPKPGVPYDLNDHYAKKHHAGRIVWSDTDLDLAILKFDRTGIPHFGKMRLHANHNELVYSTDEVGWNRSPPVGADGVISMHDLMNGLVGNGPFFSAGEVISSKHQNTEARSMVHCLTLVARGGMSGGPLVTIDNALCGIVVSGSVRRDLLHWSRLISRSYTAMVDPAFVTAKIQEDRIGKAPRAAPME
jgi:hypothetical protein